MQKFDESKFVPVESSNIHSVYFDNGLFVKFHGGAVYHYKDVPQELFLDMMEATSKGKFFNAHIKSSFAFEKAGV